MLFSKKKYTREDYKEMTEIKLISLMNKDIEAKYEYTRRKYDETDKQECLKIFNEAIKNGIVDAYWSLAILLYELEDYSQSRSIAEEGFNKGDRQCAKLLVLLYDEAGDEENAMVWRLKGAKAGVTFSMRDLGDVYYDGEGSIETDYGKAFYWYNEASKKSDTESIYKKGTMLVEGKGCTQDVERGLELVKSIVSEKDYANIYLGNLYTRGGAEGVNVKKDFKLGIQYYKNLLKNDNWARFVHLKIAVAYMYLAGTIPLLYRQLEDEFDFNEDKKRLYNIALDYCNKIFKIPGDKETAPFNIDEAVELKNKILSTLSELQ